MELTKVSSTLQANTLINAQPGNNKSEDNKKLKTKVALTSALGVAASVALISKRQGFSLNPKKIINTNIKDWAIFKIPNKNNTNGKILTFKWYDILAIGASSIIGGLAGGAIFDKKENFNAKCSEAISQFLGDISIPLGFVALPTALYKKFEGFANNPLKSIQTQNISKFVQNNKVLKILCPTLISGLSLTAGIIVGNRVSNKINEHLQGIKQERKIRLTDFAPHIDDVCLAITLMAEKSNLGSIISKFVPLALTVAGTETGIANHENRKG